MLMVMACSRKGVLCINIGDGATPRTAALAAYLTSWTAVSVDPAMRSQWQGEHPEGIGRLWSYGLKFEDWAADRDIMTAVGKECVDSVALEDPEQEQEPGSNGDEAEQRAASQTATGGDGGGEATVAAAAAAEAAEAEAKASIAYIKASPAVRDAWITWLGKQDEGQGQGQGQEQIAAMDSEPLPPPPVATDDDQQQSVGATARHGSGSGGASGALASIGFDPALHTQDTRARFCAAHATAAVADHPAAILVAPSAAQQPQQPQQQQQQLRSGQYDSVVPVVSGVAHLVLICVHAHNRFTGVAAMERIRANYGFPPTVLISLPCCHQFNPTNDLGECAHTHTLTLTHARPAVAAIVLLLCHRAATNMQQPRAFLPCAALPQCTAHPCPILRTGWLHQLQGARRTKTLRTWRSSQPAAGCLFGDGLAVRRRSSNSSSSLRQQQCRRG